MKKIDYKTIPGQKFKGLIRRFWVSGERSRPFPTKKCPPVGNGRDRSVFMLPKFYHNSFQCSAPERIVTSPPKSPSPRMRWGLNSLSHSILCVDKNSKFLPSPFRRGVGGEVENAKNNYRHKTHKSCSALEGISDNSASFNEIQIVLRLLFLFWVLTIQTFLFAQGNVRLSGRVFDEKTGLPLPGVAVQVAHTGLGVSSDPDGYFAIENIPPGVYAVTFSLLGYDFRRVDDVNISPEMAQRLSVSLKNRPIAGNPVEIISERESRGSVAGEKIVLTARQIERYQSLGVAKLLQQAAGVQIESGGGGASRATIRIHGSRGSQVLVLLDGQKMNNPQTGEVDLNEIPLTQISQIEIVRQGNTAVFGGNAFSGVIIFRSKSITANESVEIRSNAGSFSTAAGGISLGIFRGNVGASVNYQQDFSRQNFDYFYENQSFKRKNAWYRNRNGFAKFSYRSAKQQVTVTFHQRRGVQGLPSSFFAEMKDFGAFRETVSSTFQARYRRFFGARGYLEGAIGRRKLDQLFDNRRDPSPFTRYKIRQENRILEPKIDAVFLPQPTLEMRLGAQFLEETLSHENRLFPTLSIGKKSRRTRAFFGSVEYTLPKLPGVWKSAELHAAIRNEQYFDQPAGWFPFLGMSATPARLPSLNISANIARAIRYPDFNSLFWKGDARARGNPALLPERKNLWNVSARWAAPQPFLPSISLYYFSENLRDLIFWHRTVNGTWEPRNEDRAEKRGVDVQLEQALIPEHLRLQGSWSYVNAVNKSDEPNLREKQIVFTPKHTVNVSLWLGARGGQALLVYRRAGERQIVQANTGEPLPAYHLLDFSLSWQKQVSRFSMKIGAALKNLTDSDYQLLRGFPMPGREAQVNIQLKYERRQ